MVQGESPDLVPVARDLTAEPAMQGFPFTARVQVRWCDCDAFRHVNNAAVISYLEIARAELWRQRFGGADVLDIPFVIKHLECDFRRPMRLYDDVRVGLKPEAVGRTSFAFSYAVEANGTLAATARTVQVCIRHESGRPIRVPEHLRRQLDTLLQSCPGVTV